jgi:sulfite exporter TauE/SafE
MLASITPLGERGRQSHWTVTVTAFALGATVAGAVAGGFLGALGSPLAGDITGHGRTLAVAAALIAALALDLSARTVPGPRRQVDERWLDRYRGWVYGLGFGSQLGLGIVTVITSAATYVVLLCALASGHLVTGAAIMGLYGALRGLTPLLAAGVRTPWHLMALHARLRGAEAATARAGAAVLAVAGTLGLVAGLS